MTNDATTLGQLVILAGLVITAITQILLALINKREAADKANALAMKVETTAADLQVAHEMADRETRDLFRQKSEEVKAEAARAYHEANSAGKKLARLTEAINRRFDGLVDVDTGDDLREEQ